MMSRKWKKIKLNKEEKERRTMDVRTQTKMWLAQNLQKNEQHKSKITSEFPAFSLSLSHSLNYDLVTSALSHYICIYFEKWKFLLFCDRMTASLSTRRFEWISVHFGILLVRMMTAFRVCSWSEWVAFCGRMRTNGMLTRTYFDRMPSFICF